MILDYQIWSFPVPGELYHRHPIRLCPIDVARSLDYHLKCLRNSKVRGFISKTEIKPDLVRFEDVIVLILSCITILIDWNYLR